jgi:hypothetical protein
VLRLDLPDDGYDHCGSTAATATAAAATTTATTARFTAGAAAGIRPLIL